MLICRFFNSAIEDSNKRKIPSDPLQFLPLLVLACPQQDCSGVQHHRQSGLNDWRFLGGLKETSVIFLFQVGLLRPTELGCEGDSPHVLWDSERRESHVLLLRAWFPHWEILESIISTVEWNHSGSAWKAKTMSDGLVDIGFTQSYCKAVTASRNFIAFEKK